ncbi:MAG: class I SAM-dependent methyltransferase [Chloroflexota bacterium]|nr:class I SAM-dependent methyltransferase [Chloroflexota bacterium]MDQ5864377.1 class I SAM-dependent methyltransferase [Chloroflexota bacterium]
MPPSPATNPILYDLALQGPPEMFFIGPRRRKLIASLDGLVLEIGAGTGLSLRYYSPAARVVATEFDTASLPRLSSRARSARAGVVVAAADAMRLPFPDATFDALVCNLALCTIPDPHRALAEARRVLKPGAPARFLEHVRAGNRVQARVQDALAPAWSNFVGGCRLNQDTEQVIREAGLRVERVENRRGLLLPMKLVWACNEG